MFEMSIATDEAIMNDSYIQYDAMHLQNYFIGTGRATVKSNTKMLAEAPASKDVLLFAL